MTCRRAARLAFLLAGCCLSLGAGAAPVYLDFTEVANRAFRDDLAEDGQGGWTDQGGNDFREMPLGDRELCGVPFRILDPAQNRGRACLVLAGKQRPDFPKTATVKVGAKGAALAVLHALAWGDATEEPVATYTIKYADATAAALVVIPGKRILSWWGVNETATVKVAVQASNLARRNVCVHAWVWRNPHPDREIASVEFRSAEGDGVPVIVAATLLDAVPQLHSERTDRPPELAGFTWIEAEHPTASNIANNNAEWDSDLFSGRRLYSFSLGTDVVPVDQKLRQLWDGGKYQLSYEFTVHRDGEYTVWARTGPANVYSPFRWRVDQGEWGAITWQNPLLDLYEIGFWQTLGWVQLGPARLTAGKHTLFIEVPRPGAEDAAAVTEEATREIEDELTEKRPPPRTPGQPRKEAEKPRWLVEFDCFAVTSIPFHPNGVLKPGEQINRVPWLDGPARESFLDCTSQPLAAAGERNRYELDGLWEMARDQDPVPWPADAGLAALRAPTQALPAPAALAWMGVTIPHRDDRPELGLLHHRWYRKYVSLPAALKGQRVFLHFSEVNVVASVFVNGRFCGGHLGGYVPFSVELTDAFRPGERNELMVGVRGLYYFMNQPRAEAPAGFRHFWRWQAPGFPGWDHDTRDGIPDSVWLETCGRVAGRDLFVQSKYAERQLLVTLGVANGSDAEVTGKVRFVVTEPADDKEVAALGETPFTLAKGQTATVAGGGSAEKLTPWWPFAGKVYALRAEIRDGAGQLLDVCRDQFGFREVAIKDHYFTINGKRFNFRAVLTGGQGQTLDEAFAGFREFNCTSLRVPHTVCRFFPKDTQHATLRYLDEQGIPVRFCSQINGMTITLDVFNPLFWQHTTPYFRDFIKAYRNHPSIIIWVAENELDLINNMGNDERPKRSLWTMMKQAHDLDPSRPVMADGAGDLLGQCEICNWHYPEVGPIVDPNNLQEVAARQGGRGLAIYPDNAFSLARVSGSSASRPWDGKRPLFVGETYFYSGKVSWQAWLGGDEVMGGRLAANVASAEYLSLLGRGYRWRETAGYTFWTADTALPGDGVRRAFAPLAVFTRDYSRNFYAGETIKRRVKVFNDTLSAAPVHFTWELQVGGQAVDRGAADLALEEGFAEERTIALKTPAAVTARTEGELVLSLAREDHEVFSERLPAAIHPRQLTVANPAKLPVFTLDPRQLLTPYLTAWGVPPTPVQELADVKGKAGLLIVAPQALAADQVQTVSGLAPFVAAGGRVLVLEQESPLPGKVLPLDLPSTAAAGAYAFGRGAHPALAGIGPRDLCCWAADHLTFRGAYLRSPNWGVIVDASRGEGLDLAPVVELAWGRGCYLLSQMRLAPNLGRDPIADRLLANFVQYLLARPTPARLALLPAAQGGEEVVLQQAKVPARRLRGGADLEMVLETTFENSDVLLLGGAPEHLRALLASQAALRQFTARGGWVVVNGLDPAGLKPLSDLVGEALLLRPVGQERIVVTDRAEPLLAGIGNHDFYRDQKLNQEQLDKLCFLFGDAPLMENVFTGAIVYDDLAPLTHHPALANGLTADDHWRYIEYRGGDPLRLDWGAAYPVDHVSVRVNEHYVRLEELTLVLGDDAAHPLRQPVKNFTATFTFPARPLASITLTAGKTTVLKPGPYGWDLVEIHRVLPETFKQRVVPLTRPAGLVKFPLGKGGLVLNLLPLDHPLSQRVLLQLLHNLGVARGEPPAGTASPEAGALPTDDPAPQRQGGDGLEGLGE